MKNSEVALLSLVSSLLIAINTSWSKPAKFLVIISSILAILCGIKLILSSRSKNNET